MGILAVFFSIVSIDLVIYWSKSYSFSKLFTSFLDLLVNFFCFIFKALSTSLEDPGACHHYAYMI